MAGELSAKHQLVRVGEARGSGLISSCVLSDEGHGKGNEHPVTSTGLRL